MMKKPDAIAFSSQKRLFKPFVQKSDTDFGGCLSQKPPSPPTPKNPLKKPKNSPFIGQKSQVLANKFITHFLLRTNYLYTPHNPNLLF
jgi:hypothetical protein